MQSGLIAFGLDCIRAGPGGWGPAEGPGAGGGATPGGPPNASAAECIRRPNAFGGRMHSEAVCIPRQYAIKAECNQARMQSISLLPIAYCLLPIAYCLLPIAYCLLPIAYCLLPIAYCLLPIAYCLLPIAYCLLPIAPCLLPIAHCMLTRGALAGAAHRWAWGAARTVRPPPPP